MLRPPRLGPMFRHAYGAKSAASPGAGEPGGWLRAVCAAAVAAAAWASNPTTTHRRAASVSVHDSGNSRPPAIVAEECASGLDRWRVAGGHRKRRPLQVAGTLPAFFGGAQEQPMPHYQPTRSILSAATVTLLAISGVVACHRGDEAKADSALNRDLNLVTPNDSALMIVSPAERTRLEAERVRASASRTPSSTSGS